MGNVLRGMHFIEAAGGARTRNALAEKQLSTYDEDRARSQKMGDLDYKQKVLKYEHDVVAEGLEGLKWATTLERYPEFRETMLKLGAKESSYLPESFKDEKEFQEYRNKMLYEGALLKNRLEKDLIKERGTEARKTQGEGIEKRTKAETGLIDKRVTGQKEVVGLQGKNALRAIRETGTEARKTQGEKLDRTPTFGEKESLKTRNTALTDERKTRMEAVLNPYSAMTDKQKAEQNARIKEIDEEIAGKKKAAKEENPKDPLGIRTPAAPSKLPYIDKTMAEIPGPQNQGLHLTAEGPVSKGDNFLRQKRPPRPEQKLSITTEGTVDKGPNVFRAPMPPRPELKEVGKEIIRQKIPKQLGITEDEAIMEIQEPKGAERFISRLKDKYGGDPKVWPFLVKKMYYDLAKAYPELIAVL